MNKKMNKRGDLPVTLLVIGVFAVCTLAILSFFYSSMQIKESFVGIKIIENANTQIELHNLDNFYDYKNVTRFSPSFGGENGISLFKEKTIFSVEYNP